MLIAVFLAPDFVPEYHDAFDTRITEWALNPNNTDIAMKLYHPKYNLDYYPE